MPSKLTPPLNQHDHVLGSPHATLQLVEYGDFQCPHCGAAYPIVKQLEEKYGKQMLFAWRHFPLSNVHEMAIPAAIAAEAAGRQGKFWEMHSQIFEYQSRLRKENIFHEFAKAIGLDIAAFDSDITDEALREKVEADFESGIRSGVNGTPSFYFNGHKYMGDYSYESLSAEIEKHLAEKAHN